MQGEDSMHITIDVDQPIYNSYGIDLKFKI